MVFRKESSAHNLEQGISRNVGATHYVIWREPGAGFFSILSGILGHLHIAETFGLQPVIDMQNYPGTYSESEPILGTHNMWEYYFQPVGRIESVGGMDSMQMVDSGGQYPFQVLNFPYAAVPWLPAIYDRYVRLRDESISAIDAARIAIEPDDATLAVHFRGKEMRNALHHPMPPSEQQILRRIDLCLEQHSFDRIFLVTEGADYVDAFKRRYGRMVNYLDVARSGSENIDHEYPRPHHRYLLGLEILTEASLMSECGGLVCGYSNVSQMTEVMARGNFKVLERIWNGKLRGGRFVAQHLWNFRSRAPRILGGFNP